VQGSKILQSYLKEKNVSTCVSTVASENTFINELNNEKKIASLNETILKLNGIIEKNMRKISSQEKEIQFISKRMREAENLNIRMVSDLSTKNQLIESLSNELKKKKETKNEKPFKRENKRGVSTFEGAPEIFMKSISDIIIKELATLNIKANIGNTGFEKYFEDVKMTFKTKDCVLNTKNVIDINISQNIYLKNLLKMYISGIVGSKKFNTSNVSHAKAASISLKNSNFGLHNDKNDF